MSGGSNPDNSSMEPVTESGSEYNATLEVMSMRPEANITERLVNASYDKVNSSYILNFDGVMKFNSPCYRPDINVIGSGTDRYTVNIHAKKLENRTCTQVITEVRYSFEFESDSPFKLEASQGNLSETFTPLISRKTVTQETTRAVTKHLQELETPKMEAFCQDCSVGSEIFSEALIFLFFLFSSFTTEITSIILTLDKFILYSVNQVRTGSL
ncbi:MAG: hypothetical protein ABEK04_02265 [Candidatus Nanohalobium sp.]